jgi:hypothetical protein
MMILERQSDTLMRFFPVKACWWKVEDRVSDIMWKGKVETRNFLTLY